VVDLNEVVRVGATFARHELRHRARLVLELGEVPKIPANRGRLVQVVSNLLVNAAQAIQEGDASHNEVCVKTWLDGDQAVLSVHDTGAGIPEELRERIFEPFFTTKEGGRGVGLGLSLCSDIVHRLGGEIVVESEVGRGARFDVRLPVADPISRPRPVCSTSLPVVSPQQGMRVLVVDDDELFRRAFLRMLSGHDVVLAPGGAEALALIRQDHDFDVVLCDVMMPDVDGPHVYAALERDAPELRERTVFCTGGAITARMRAFLEAISKSNEVVEKPVQTDHLRQVVQRVGARGSR